MRPGVTWLFLVAVAMMSARLAACGGTCPACPATPPAASCPAASSAQKKPDLSLVTASVVVNECPDAQRMNHHAARRAIKRLVDPCAGVPGGSARFSAKFLPGGRIELGSPTGDPSEGVVPTCVLHHNLRHQVFLRKACVFDVALDQRPTPAPDTR